MLRGPQVPLKMGSKIAGLFGALKKVMKKIDCQHVSLVTVNLGKLIVTSPGNWQLKHSFQDHSGISQV